MSYPNLKKLWITFWTRPDLQELCCLSQNSKQSQWRPKGDSDVSVQGGVHHLPDTMGGRLWGNRTYRAWRHIWKFSRSFQIQKFSQTIPPRTWSSACPHRRLLQAWWPLRGYGGTCRCALSPPREPRRCSSWVLHTAAATMHRGVGMFRDLACSPWALRK